MIQKYLVHYLDESNQHDEWHEVTLEKLSDLTNITKYLDGDFRSDVSIKSVTPILISKPLDLDELREQGLMR